MAGSTVIGALRVVLGMDTAAFEEGSKKAQTQAEKTSASLNKAFAVLATVAAGAVVGFASAILHSIDKLDKLGKASEKAGIPIADFAALASTASKAGVDLDSFTAGVVKLSKAMSEAGSGKLAGTASLAFEALGISARDASGRLADTSDVIIKLADKFASFKDSPEKTALAIALFGRAGAEMIPFLNKGGEAIRKQKEEMERLGVAMDDATKNKAREFTEGWGKLTHVLDSVVTRLAIGMLPALNQSVEALVKLTKDAKSMSAIGETLAYIFKAVAIEGIRFAFQVGQIGKDIAGLAEAIGLALPSLAAWGKISLAIVTRDVVGLYKATKDLYENSGNLTAALKKWNEVTVASEEANKRFADSMKGVWDDPKKGVQDYTTEIIALGKEILGLSHFKLDAPKLPTESVTKAIQDLQFKTRELKNEFIGLPEGFAGLARGLDPLVKLTPTIGGLTAEMQRLALAQAENNVAMAYRATLTPYQKDQEDLTKLGVSLAAIGIKGQVAADIIEKTALKMSSSWKMATTDITTNMASGFAALASVNKKFAAAAKIAAYAQAIWSTYAGAAKALELYGPTPIGFAAAAAAVVAGLGMVAKISAQGFAHGGSFKVGGSGGTDSKLVQFMATPGEMVDIKTPGQQSSDSGGSSSSSGGVTEITLRARRLTDMMTLDDLRGLIDNLNSANRDGYKLKFAS